MIYAVGRKVCQSLSYPSVKVIQLSKLPLQCQSNPIVKVTPVPKLYQRQSNPSVETIPVSK